MHQDADWIKGLNPQQQQAVLHNHGPLLILAGAGSGKTTVLVSRTGRLIQEQITAPEAILVLTFTNKAARELKERVARKVGAAGQNVWAGTFHSFGLQILRENHERMGLPSRFGVIDSTDSRALIKEILRNHFNGEKSDFDPERLRNLMALQREGKKPPPDAHPADVEMAEMLCPRYLEALKMWGAVDFDGLLMEPLALFKQYPEVLQEYQQRFQQIMVDEFQDTNRIQMQLVDQLSMVHRNVTVVGDDDQSIYGWRGADISNILNFPNRFKECKVVRLETNYRSTPTILNLANSVIAKNSKRHKKTLKPFSDNSTAEQPELFVYESDEEEIEEVVGQIRYFQSQGYCLNQIAVLFRSNSQGGMLEGSLRHHDIAYALAGGSGFFDRKEVRDAYAYIVSAVSPNDICLRRILNTPGRGIGKKSFDLLEEYSRNNEVSFRKALYSWKEAGVKEKTGHSIESLLGLLAQLRELLWAGESLQFAEKLPEFFRQIGYRDYVFDSYKDPKIGQKKWQLIEIFGRILDGFIQRNESASTALRKFVDAIGLRDQVDEDEKDDTPKVQLLTLHACKGLEFPVVIMIGAEEGILPHETLGQDVDEERRLFYVGVTRAQERLVLTRSRQRKRYGRWRPAAASRFVVEIPGDLLKVFENGTRPLSEGDRKDLVRQLLAKL